VHLIPQPEPEPERERDAGTVAEYSSLPPPLLPTLHLPPPLTPLQMPPPGLDSIAEVEFTPKATEPVDAFVLSSNPEPTEGTQTGTEDETQPLQDTKSEDANPDTKASRVFEQGFARVCT
jgi:hypothetical protein